MDESEITTINFRHFLGPDTVFTKEAAENLIGQYTNFRDLSNEIFKAKIVKANLSEFGHTLELTLEISDPDKRVQKQIERGNINRNEFSFKKVDFDIEGK